MHFSGFGTNAKWKERIDNFIYTNDIEKQKPNPKKVIYGMATLLEAVVSSVFWKSELEKAISDHLPHQSEAGWAVA